MPKYDALLEADEKGCTLDCGCTLDRPHAAAGAPGAVAITFCKMHRRAGKPVKPAKSYIAQLEVKFRGKWVVLREFPVLRYSGTWDHIMSEPVVQLRVTYPK